MKAIVVVDRYWGIGRQGKLLFHLPKDMAFFRQTTLDKVVVMGAVTYSSFPHGALTRRTNIVLDDSGKQYPDAQSADTVEKLHDLLACYPKDDVFVIGGASVYGLLLDECDEIFVTKVDADGNAEQFFSNLDNLPEWRLATQSDPTEDNGYTIRFCRYEKFKL